MTRLLKHKIRPILVFDGHAPSEKKHTIDQRSQIYQKKIDKLKDRQMELVKVLTQEGVPHEELDPFIQETSTDPILISPVLLQELTSFKSTFTAT